MRIEQLQHLVEIAKYNSLSKAAENLHISQQALSATIKSMERELNCQLLIRTHRGIALSEAGRTMAVGAGKLICDYQNLLLKLHQKEAPQLGTVKISVAYGLMEAYFSQVAAQICTEKPDLSLEVTENTPEELVARLKAHSCDIGLVTYTTGIGCPLWEGDQALAFTPMFTGRLHLRVGRQSPLANYSSISIKTALKEPVLVYQPKLWVSNPLVETLHFFCEDCRILFEENYQLHHQKLLNNLGVSFAIGLSPADGDNLRLIPLKENIEVVNGYLIAADTPLLPQQRYILDYLQIASAQKR